VSTSIPGKVQTVLGSVPAEAVGVTLPHEHLLVDLTAPYFSERADVASNKIARSKFTVEMREQVIEDCNSNLDNLRLDDEETAADELRTFGETGGNTIVELTSTDIGRDPHGLRRLARRTGLNIVMGCGYYIDRSQPATVRARTEEDIAEEMVEDLLTGAAGTKVRAGIIGEIGVDTLSEQERKVLRAAVRAQHATGASINVHVEFIMGGREAGLWAHHVLEEAGADLTRVVFSHQDSSGEDRGYQNLLLRDGIVLEYDGFGYEMKTKAYGGLTYPTDDDRIESIQALLSDGWQNQLLISTDICMKFLLRSFGGHGYGHILQSVVPRMRRAGIEEDALQAMLVETPRRLLAQPDRSSPELQGAVAS
jgi:phosphotriesterase-related protein